MPKLRLEDCVSYKISDAVYLTDYLVRFQLVQPRKISEYMEFVLHERSDIDALFPNAPNRDAVLYNVNTVRKELDNVFFRIKKSWFARTFNITSPLDFLKFSINHTSEPTYIFTNGQRFMSVVVKNEQRFETVRHSGRLSSYQQETHELIEPESAACFSSYGAAETVIRQQLAELSIRAVLMGDGVRQETMLLQEAGSAYKGGQHVDTYLAWINGEPHYLETNRDIDSYTLVNTFRSGGLRIESCGTCSHFRFSGMSHDMSNGSTGYCTKRLVPGKTDFDIKRDEPTPFAVVSVWDRCLEYSFVEDHLRPNPWCRNR